MKIKINLFLIFSMLTTAHLFAQQAGDLDNAFGSLGISIADNNGYR